MCSSMSQILEMIGEDKSGVEHVGQLKGLSYFVYLVMNVTKLVLSKSCRSVKLYTV